MKCEYFPEKIFAIVASSALSVGTYAQALAENATEAKPLELRKIMQEPGKDMQAITDGISREDWELVAKIAPWVAEHPQRPLGEKMRILSFIGTESGKFKDHDEKTHEAARALEQAAARNDGQNAIAALANLQNRVARLLPGLHPGRRGSHWQQEYVSAGAEQPAALVRLPGPAKHS